MDSVSPERRSEIMARIRSKDTRPEMVVRRLVFSLGYRYRLHRKDLPGKPDLVFSGRGKVIFVHGCFWHQHAGCPGGRLPKSRRAFWRRKFAGNVARDAEHRRALRRLGWRVLIVWECQTKKLPALARRLSRFLEG